MTFVTYTVVMEDRHSRTDKTFNIIKYIAVQMAAENTVTNS